MAVVDVTALKWVRDDYVRGEMERQRCALEGIVPRRSDREEGDIVILDDSDEEVLGPSNPVRHGDPGQGAARMAAKRTTTTMVITPISISFSACRRRRRRRMAAT
ncbi:Cysteine-rich receptor-like protein kinase 10 [Hordeum vulgare]|nr:Cysteine-rich receptor-like protein kinase 10 [Hordeum vulgare]